MQGLIKDLNSYEFKNTSKKIPTNEEGIFFKQIINEKCKEVDKIYLITYRESHRDKLKTAGKYSQNIRIKYCKQIWNKILNKILLG